MLDSRAEVVTECTGTSGAKFDFRCPGFLNYPQGVRWIEEGMGSGLCLGCRIPPVWKEFFLELQQDSCNVQCPTIFGTGRRTGLVFFLCSPSQKEFPRSWGPQTWLGGQASLFSPFLSLKWPEQSLDAPPHAEWLIHTGTLDRNNTPLWGRSGAQHTQSGSQPRALLTSLKQRPLNMSCWHSEADRKCIAEFSESCG